MLLLAACGGSGSSGGGSAAFLHPDTLFAGSYFVAGIQGEQEGAESIAAYWGSATSAGAGEVELASASNRLGVVDPLSAPESIPYGVGLDRLFEIIPQYPGISFFRGGICENGDMAAAAGVLADFQPTVLLLGRRGGTHDESSLAGIYRYARYGGTVAGVTNVAGWGTFTFDGAGGGSYELNVNQEGVVFGPANPLFTYEVDPDGTLRLDLGGGAELEGAVVAGGDVLLASGGTLPGSDPVTCVLVRQGAGLADADFVGEYFMLALLHDPATGAYSAFTGVLVADGAGASYFLGLRNEDGVVTVQEADTVATSVAPDGTVTFTTSSGDSFLGGMSPDGRFVAAAGTTNAGGAPIFLFLMR
jgi:hypothetical protein